MWIGEKKNTVNGIWEHYDGAQFEVSFEPQWDFKDQPDEMTTARGKILSHWPLLIRVSRIFNLLSIHISLY